MQKCHFFYYFSIYEFFSLTCDHRRVVWFVALALDLTPLAGLKVHLDQDQLIHSPSGRILHLLLVHHNLIYFVVHIRPENYGKYKKQRNIGRKLAIRVFFLDMQFGTQKINKAGFRRSKRGNWLQRTFP